MATSISVREILRHVPKPTSSPFSIRDVFGKKQGEFRLRSEPFPFSMLSYNLGLLPWPADYLGTDRTGAIAEVIKRIKSDPSDVWGYAKYSSMTSANVLEII
jgi:hypothetical protein